ncbi:Flp pilus assembly protein TadG [uncultured Pleomorphomonas sp.]|uniref:Flp pilus assembly protein TadG n=1 Tax=uncultured Pleomorphomonas sp. TaxID=442121 RepID=A0A212KYE8_9HYPH|nr:pilus assembly protein [uncultured Pleomorphomonas sp.]SCM70328.1 Flp pilus assembly protein TadG [uncultured Pleomorphomonas sp.]
MGIRRFLVCRDGNVAMIFAVCLLPLLVGIGAAVDYARLADARETMQNSIDATTLALSSEAASLSTSTLQTRALEIFNVNFPSGKVDSIAVSATYTRSNGANVSATATGSVPMTFMNIVGVSSKTVSVSSTSNWSTQHLRVALVLDNSGSMKDSGKMTALKKATKNLLSTLKSAAVEDGDVYVSIIPFNKDVDVGKDKYTETWLNWTDWEADSVNKTTTSTTTCTGRPKKCTTTYDTKINDHSTWTGCVTDRNKDYDVGIEAPVSANTKFYPEQYSDCPAQLTPLTYNWTTLDTAVDAMTPVGATNQTIGLVWGWQSLVSTSPLDAPVKDANIDYLDVVILLTDGVNTKNRWNGNGSSQSSDVDTRTSLACTAAKAAGVSIFTVLVMDGNATLLRDCASSSDQYFKLTSADQIITTFNTIGTKLSKLRIAQ